MRHPVYQLPRGQGGEAMRIRWYALVEEYTEWCNRLLPVPMRPARVQSTARSIARWTWVNPNFGRGDVMGWKDPVRQRERALISARVRQERRRPRNCRIVDLHHSGWTIERIARQEGLSWIQNWRIVGKDRAVPGIYHQPIAPSGKVEVEGVELRGNDENRNGCADDLFNETRPQQPIERLAQPILAAQSAEITPLHAPDPTPGVDNLGSGVDNPQSPWDEAIRQGVRRRAEEVLRRSERERRSWMNRGPPEE